MVKRDTNCSICKNKAVIYLPYSQRSLCKRHFLDFFERRVKRTIREFHLLDGVNHLGVAVSGGKDSLTTLHILHQITSPTKVKMTAILVDEGIEGYRNKSIKDAKRICKQLGVPLKIYSFKKEIGKTMDQITKKKEREVSCTYCGVFRRWILNKAAKKLKIDKIAIGHNLDDVVQSFLMNTFRNEPFRLARFGATSGIIEDEGFVQRIRPLFKTPEKETALYSILQGFNVTFGSCPYLEEGFRPVVRNFINELESRYPGTKFKTLNDFMVIRKMLEKEYLKKVADIPISKCKKCGEPTSAKICKKCEFSRLAEKGLNMSGEP